MKTRYHRIEPRLGQAAFFPNEGKDCTVHALAIVQGCSYALARSRCAVAGRKPGQRFAFWNVAHMLGMSAYYPPRGTTAAQAVATLPFGHWVIQVKNHVYALVQGAVWDTLPKFRARQHVWMIYGWEDRGIPYKKV